MYDVEKIRETVNEVGVCLHVHTSLFKFLVLQEAWHLIRWLCFCNFYKLMVVLEHVLGGIPLGYFLLHT